MDVERECKVDQTHKDDELLIELDMVLGCVVDIGVVINLVSLIEWYEANSMMRQRWRMESVIVSEW